MWNTGLGNQYYSGGSGGTGGYQSQNQSYGGGNYGGSGRTSAQQYAPASTGSGYASRAPRVFTGHVTKLQDTFGIIDNDVFFQFSVVKGKTPGMSDKVLVEAVYNGDLPFKWHATSVQSLGGGASTQYSGGQRGGGGAGRSSYQAAAAAGGGGGGGASAYSGRTAAVQDSGYSKSSKYDSPRGGGGGGGYDSGYKTYDSRKGGSGRREVYEKSSERQYDSGRRGGGGVNESRAPREYRRDDSRSSPPRGRGLSPEKQSYHQRKPQARSRTPSQHGRGSPEKSRKRSRSPKEEYSSRGGYEKSRDGSVASTHVRDRSKDREQFKRVSLKYNVKPPRYPLDVIGLDVTEVKRRFEGMSIPVNFAHVKFSYQTTFPAGKKSLNLGHNVKYHIMDAMTVNPDSPVGSDAPSDLDSSFSVTVMLLASNTVDELYAKCCKMNAGPAEKLQHLTKSVSFLLPHKSNKDIVLIGGSWSPSLDGADPTDNPGVLINTAIRVTKAQTGIDLSRCANWYTIAELFTVAPGDKFTGQPDKTQRRVVLMPDVWSVIPSDEEWAAIQEKYRQLGEDKALELEPPPSPVREPMEDDSGNQDSAAADLDTVSDDEAIFANQEEESPYPVKNKTPSPKKAKTKSNEEADAVKTPKSGEAQPILTPNTMKVTELKAELAARDLDTKGLKNALVARLEEALADEAKITVSEEPMEQDDVSEAPKETVTEPASSDSVEEVKADEEDAPMTTIDEIQDEVTLQAEDEELLPKSSQEKEDGAEEDDGPSDVAKMGVSMFLKQQEDKQKEEAERLQREIQQEKERIEKEEREERERKEKEEKERAEAKAREEKEKAARERKEKQDLIRNAYTLPETPSIVVHAAEGQTCKTVPYNSLLDRVYADTKDNAFVLEMFAETLYEMLQRDFAYEIYRALVAAPDPEIIKREKEEAEKKAAAEEKARKEEEERVKREAAEEAARLKAEKDAADAAAAEAKKEAGIEDDESTEVKEEENGDDAEVKEEETTKAEGDDEAPPNKKQKQENGNAENQKTEPISDDEADITEVKPKVVEEAAPVVVKKKIVYRTVYPHLLLAFSFFDRSFSGYIKERDLEDMIDALGLALSRQQVRDLVKKVTKLELVNYHELTDQKIEEGVNVEYQYHADIPQGNRSYIFSSGESSGSSSSKGSGNFVQFQGQAINLVNVMAQIEQFSQLSTQLQSRVLSLEKDNDTLKKNFDGEALECATLKKKLNDTRVELEQKKQTNTALVSVQDSLKKLMHDNVSSLDSVSKTITKKLVELNPPPPTPASAPTAATNSTMQ